MDAFSKRLYQTKCLLRCTTLPFTVIVKLLVKLQQSVIVLLNIATVS